MKHLKKAIKLISKSLKDLSFEDIPEDYVGYMDDASAMEAYLIDFAIHKGYAPYEYPEEEINEESIEFKEWLRNTLEDKFLDIQYEFGQRINPDDTIDIYRAIKVPDEWFSELPQTDRNLGIYWSYDSWHAEPHWAEDFPNTALIHGRVLETNVDWQSSFEVNLDPVLGEEEKEIRLYDGVPVEIIGITINWEEQDITTLKGKQFYARNETAFDKYLKNRLCDLEFKREYKEALNKIAIETWNQAEQLADKLEELGVTVTIDKSQSTKSVYLYIDLLDEEGLENIEEWTVRLSDHPPKPNFRGRYPIYDVEIGPYLDADTASWEDAYLVLAKLIEKAKVEI